MKAGDRHRSPAHSPRLEPGHLPEKKACSEVVPAAALDAPLLRHCSIGEPTHALGDRRPGTSLHHPIPPPLHTMKTHSVAPTKFTRHSLFACPVSRLLHGQIEVLEARIAPATIIVTDLGDNFTVDGKITFARQSKAANTDTSIDGSVAGSGADIHHLRAGADRGRCGDDSVFHKLLTGSPDDRSGVGPTTAGRRRLRSRAPSRFSPTGDNGITIQRDSGSPEFRLFYVTSAASLTVKNLTLTSGLAHGADGGPDGAGTGGGAAGLGGAIFNQGSLTIDSSALSGNKAQGGAGGLFRTLLGNAKGAGGGGVGGVGAPENVAGATNPGGGPNGGSSRCLVAVEK